MTRISPALVCRALLPVVAAATLVAPAWSAGAAPPDARTTPLKPGVPQPWTPPPGTAAPQATTPKPDLRYVGGIPDTAGAFLPDSAMLASVDGRKLTAGEFVQTWYNAYAADLPKSDSLGRVEWLNSMVDREVMGRVARKVNRPFTYEDRLQLRQHTQRVLANVLYVRAVLDSVTVTPDDVRAVLPQFEVEHHLRRLQFLDQPSADKALADLRAKRMTWEEAARRYRFPEDKAKPDGDMGWVGRMALPYRSAQAVYALKTGEISPVVEETDVSYIWQVLGERRGPEYNAKTLAAFIRDQLHNERVRSRVERLMDEMRREAGMRYDSANVAYAAALFEPPLSTEVDSRGAPTFHISNVVPVVGPQDTSRVLARFQGGQLTLGGFLQMYSDLSPVARPTVTTVGLFCRQIDSFALEPWKAMMAQSRGLDKDSLAVAMIEKERERILVEHMYRDSIESKIKISVAERRKFYEGHRARYFTYQTARYATFASDDSAGAEAIAARLRRGEKAEDILRADSIAGREPRGAIHEERENESSPVHKLVFETLKPGRVQVGPGSHGIWITVQLLSIDPGRQLSFEESDGYVYDTLASIEAEKQLKQFFARHRKQFKIVTRPKLVMRIRLVPPGSGA